MADEDQQPDQQPGSDEHLRIEGLSEFEEIGRGASGRVFRAYEAELDRQVAVKVFHRALDADEQRRFEREVRMLGGLSGHPNIVTIYRHGTSGDGQPFIVMDLMGTSVASSIPTDIATATDVATATLKALEEAHSKGFVHRDIKPDNVFIDRYGEARLGDFGVGGVSDTSSMTRGSIGSPAYMAPEVINAEPATAASDVYSLAVTVYQLIEGRLPFAVPSGGIAPLFRRILEDDPDPATKMPDGYEQALRAAMSKDPAARPTPAQFSAALTAAAVEGAATASDAATMTIVDPVPAQYVASAPPLSAPPTPPNPPTPSAPPSPPSSPSPPTSPVPADQTSGSGGRRWGWIIAGAAAVVAVLVAVVLIINGGSDGGNNVEVASNDAVLALNTSGNYLLPTGEQLNEIDLSAFLVDVGDLGADGVSYAIATASTVNGAAQISLAHAASSQEVSASVVGTSTCNDLALLELRTPIEATPLPWAVDAPTVGDTVMSIGAIAGKDVTQSVSGAVSREPGDLALPFASPTEVIEHDALPTFEMLGGPLVDADGAIVGANVGLEDGSGFAVGAATVRQFIEELLSDDGSGSRSALVDGLGLNLLALDDASGIWVAAVKSGSPADQVGLRPGDLITVIEGVPANIDGTVEVFCDVVQANPAGVMALTVSRDGQEMSGQLNSDRELTATGAPVDVEPTTTELPVITEVPAVTLEPATTELPVITEVPATTSAPIAPGVAGSYEPFEFVPFTDDSGLLAISLPSADDDRVLVSTSLGLDVAAMGAEVRAENNVFGQVVYLALPSDDAMSLEEAASLFEPFGLTCSPSGSSFGYTDAAFEGDAIDVECGEGTGFVLVASQTGTSQRVLLATFSTSPDLLRELTEAATATFVLL